MRVFYPVFFLLMSLWNLTGCTKPGAGVNTSPMSSEKAATMITPEQLISEGYTCTPAPGEGAYLLCLSSKKVAPNLPQIVTRYWVFHQPHQKPILQDSVFNGTVKWHSSHELSIFQAPGTAAREAASDTFTNIIDLEK